MADTYKNFEELAAAETSGVDYDILIRRETVAFAVVAPHGGGIEGGTSELADAAADPAANETAGERHSFYAFEGLKPRGNGVLHITSTCFNEPMCLTLIGACERVVTIHGEQSTGDVEIFVGGLDETLGRCVTHELEADGFTVGIHPDGDLQGRDLKNLCNRGTTRAGVQLELSQGVRLTMFESLSAEGRKHKKPRFGVFVAALRRALRERAIIT
jgi:phage replication-related protein YjqB (UPF0714/DUF867 family)